MDDAQIIIDARPEILQYLSADALKITPPRPMSDAEIEQALSAEIRKIDRAFLRRIEADGVASAYAKWADYEAELRVALEKPMRKYIYSTFASYSDYVNFLDVSGVLADVDNAVTQQISKTAAAVTRTTRSMLDEMILAGGREADVIERIAYRFGSGHAETVAVTEATRARAEFANALQARLSEQGVVSAVRWMTSEDEKVCPICGPADGKLETDKITSGGWSGQTWRERFGKPPAHPNCRCKTSVELVKNR